LTTGLEGWQMRRRQSGVSVFSFVLIAAMVGLLGYGALRLAPIYMTQMSVRSILNTLKLNNDGQNANAAQVKSELGKQLDIEMISFPHVRDFVVQKTDEGLVVSVAYEERVPFVANVSLVAEFSNKVEIQR
jgi:hypothetical protein